MTRRSYTDSDRRAVVTSARELSVSEAARRHGVARSTVTRWVADAPRDEPAERRARLGADGPTAGVASAPTLQKAIASHPILAANAKQIHRTLMAAQSGDPTGLQDLYDDIRDRDDRADAVSRTRVLALQGRKWAVKAPPGYEEDARAQEIAERMTRIIGEIRAGGSLDKQRGGGGWASVVGQFADGILRGYSVNEIEWSVNAQSWKVPKTIHWRHANRFIFNDCLELAKRDIGDPSEGVPLDSFGADKFVVHSPNAGRVAYPMRRGVLIPVVFSSLVKRAVLKFWLKAAERWGSPIPIGILPAELGPPSSDVIKDSLTNLNNLTQDSVSLFYGGMTVETLGGSRQMDPEFYERLYQSMNVAMAVSVLGQNLTTEVQGGSFAAARAHERVREDVHLADCVELDATVRHQLIAPIMRYNWPGEPIPVYETQTEIKGDITLEGVRLGVYSQNEHRASKGRGPKPDGTGDTFGQLSLSLDESTEIEVADVSNASTEAADDPDPKAPRAMSPPTSATSRKAQQTRDESFSEVWERLHSGPAIQASN